MSTPVTIYPKQGMVRTDNVLFNPENCFKTLVNCRVSQGGGRIEQTPCFKSVYNYAAGSRVVRFLVEAMGTILSVGTEAFIANTKLQVITKTTSPGFATTELATQGCLLIVTSYPDLALTLNQTFEVEITATDKFKWRKNGGAYSADVTIGLSTAVDHVVLYFLATTGFNAGDRWVWTRTDLTVSGGFYREYNHNIYFLGDTNASGYTRLLVYDGNLGIRDGGYFPTYGLALEIYYGHIMLYHGGSNAWPNAYNVYNSDNVTLENFLPTDTNEADRYTFKDNTNNVRFAILRGVLYLFTQDSVYYTNYLGLPIVFDYQKLQTGFPFKHSTYLEPVVSPSGVYIWTTQGLACFDGLNLKIIDTLAVTSWLQKDVIYQMKYDSNNREVLMATGFAGSTSPAYGDSGLYVYQEESQSWFIRVLQFNATDLSVVLPTLTGLVVGLSTGTKIEDWLWNVTPSYDAINGTTFQKPIVETHDLAFGIPGGKKEIDGLYFDGTYSTGATGAPYGTLSVAISVAARESAENTKVYVATPGWLKTALTGDVSYRTHGRTFSALITTVVAAGIATKQFIFDFITLNVNGLPPRNAEK